MFLRITLPHSNGTIPNAVRPFLVELRPAEIIVQLNERSYLLNKVYMSHVFLIVAKTCIT